MADVVTTGEARDSLHQIARRFDDGDGEPVYFGSHRRAQGVVVPVDVREKLLEQAEDELDLASVRQRVTHDAGRRLTGGDLDLEHATNGEVGHLCGRLWYSSFASAPSKS